MHSSALYFAYNQDRDKNIKRRLTENVTEKIPYTSDHPDGDTLSARHYPECCGAHDEEDTTLEAATTTVTFHAATGKGYFKVVPMEGLADPAELTKASDSTEVPEVE